MSMTRIMVWISLFAPTLVVSSGVSAQNYPAKPIRISLQEAGGGVDVIIRMIAPGLASGFAQPVIPENRPGVVIAAQAMIKAPPDGYVLFANGAAYWTNPLLQKIPYDPLTDSLPVALLQLQPLVLVVHPSLPVKSVKDLIALAKSKPGELNFASSGVGANSHLTVELFKAAAGVNIAH